MATRTTRSARQAKPAAAAPKPLSLAEQFMNESPDTGDDSSVLSRERVPASYRATIESVTAKRSTSNRKFCYAVIAFKKGGKKTLGLAYPTCKVNPGTQLDLKTLEFVTTIGDDGNKYLNLDGKPL